MPASGFIAYENILISAYLPGGLSAHLDGTEPAFNTFAVRRDGNTAPLRHDGDATFALVPPEDTTASPAPQTRYNATESIAPSSSYNTVESMSLAALTAQLIANGVDAGALTIYSNAFLANQLGLVGARYDGDTYVSDALAALREPLFGSYSGP